MIHYQFFIVYLFILYGLTIHTLWPINICILYGPSIYTLWFIHQYFIAHQYMYTLSIRALWVCAQSLLNLFIPTDGFTRERPIYSGKNVKLMFSIWISFRHFTQFGRNIFKNKFEKILCFAFFLYLVAWN